MFEIAALLLLRINYLYIMILSSITVTRHLSIFTYSVFASAPISLFAYVVSVFFFMICYHSYGYPILPTMGNKLSICTFQQAKCSSIKQMDHIPHNHFCLSIIASHLFWIFSCYFQILSLLRNISENILSFFTQIVTGCINL